MDLASFNAWRKQPTTILGIAGIVGTVSGYVAHVLTHDITATTAVGLSAASIVHIAMPDNSAAPTSVEKLAVDAVTAIATRKLSASIPLLFGDAVAVAQAVQTPPSPAPVVTSPTV